MKKTKCETLNDVNLKVKTNRLKLQKKLRKKKYKKKGLRVFKTLLTTKEYLIIRYFYLKLEKHDKIRNDDTKEFIRNFLKFNCTNVFFRNYYIGFETYKNYKSLKESSFFTYDKRVILDKVIVDIITNNNN